MAKIDSPVGYEGGRPKAGGLSDPRMGTMDRALKCTTDGAGVQDSPGYFGHIELAKPCYHVGFLTTVIKVLRCVSFHSSKILLDKVRAVSHCRKSQELKCEQRLGRVSKSFQRKKLLSSGLGRHSASSLLAGHLSP